MDKKINVLIQLSLKKYFYRKNKKPKRHNDLKGLMRLKLQSFISIEMGEKSVQFKVNVHFKII